jgi:hypothetical protein
MRNAECGVRSEQWGVRKEECGLRDAECGMRNEECKRRSRGIEVEGNGMGRPMVPIAGCWTQQKRYSER